MSKKPAQNTSKKRQPWLRFYTADWRGDAGLRAVGFAARGLWIDMLTLMHEATPYGHLVLNEVPLDAARLAARIGGTAKEVQQLLDRLETENVFSRTRDGAIYSRRMVNDAAKAERDRLNGKEGGNPAIKTRPKDKAEDNEGGNGQDNEGVNPQDNLLDKARAAAARAPPLPETRGTVPRGTDAEPASADLTPADLLWSVGLPILRRISGKSDGQCRALLGKMRRDMEDDCPRLLLILQQAGMTQHADPIAWLAKATRPNQVQDVKARRDEQTLRAAGLWDDQETTIDHEPRGMLQ